MARTTDTPAAAQQVLPVVTEHITATPGVCDGKPRLIGHRIRVQDIVVWHERLGMKPSDIVSQHPGVTLGDVHAALTYYHDHRDEIDQSIQQGEEAYTRLKAQQPSLLERIAARRPDVLVLSNAAALAYIRSGHCPPEDIERLRADLPRRLEQEAEDADLAELREELTLNRQG